MRSARVFDPILLTGLAARADEVSLSILATSAGSWEEELYYLDYQSGQRFGIPMQVEAELTPDGESRFFLRNRTELRATSE